MFRNLVARNRDVPQEQLQRQLAANGGVGRNPVQLPFILIQVSNKSNAMQLNLMASLMLECLWCRSASFLAGSVLLHDSGYEHP